MKKEELGKHDGHNISCQVNKSKTFGVKSADIQCDDCMEIIFSAEDNN